MSGGRDGVIQKVFGRQVRQAGLGGRPGRQPAAREAGGPSRQPSRPAPPIPSGAFQECWGAAGSVPGGLGGRWEQFSIEISGFRGQKVWQPVAACGGLWQPVAPCGITIGCPLIKQFSDFRTSPGSNLGSSFRTSPGSNLGSRGVQDPGKKILNDWKAVRKEVSHARA